MLQALEAHGRIVSKINNTNKYLKSLVPHTDPHKNMYRELFENKTATQKSVV